MSKGYKMKPTHFMVRNRFANYRIRGSNRHPNNLRQIILIDGTRVRIENYSPRTTQRSSSPRSGSTLAGGQRTQESSSTPSLLSAGPPLVISPGHIGTLRDTGINGNGGMLTSSHEGSSAQSLENLTSASSLEETDTTISTGSRPMRMTHFHEDLSAEERCYQMWQRKSNPTASLNPQHQDHGAPGSTSVSSDVSTGQSPTVPPTISSSATLLIDIPLTSGESPSQSAAHRILGRHRKSYEKWRLRKDIVTAVTGSTITTPTASRLSPKFRSRSVGDQAAVPPKRPRLDNVPVEHCNSSPDYEVYSYSCASLDLYQIRQRAQTISANLPLARMGSVETYVIINGCSNAKKNTKQLAEAYEISANDLKFVNSRPNLFAGGEPNAVCGIFRLRIDNTKDFPFTQVSNSWKTVMRSSEIIARKSSFIFHFISVSEMLRLYVLATAAELYPVQCTQLSSNWKLSVAMEDLLITAYRNKKIRDDVEKALTQTGRRRLVHEMLSLGWSPEPDQTPSVITASGASSSTTPELQPL